MNQNETAHSQQTDDWLRGNGIQLRNLYVGSTELFQAQKMATNTLKNYGHLLAKSQAHTLNKFLKSSANKKTREKITQGQCFKVMNIAKQVQRLSAKQNKAR